MTAPLCLMSEAQVEDAFLKAPPLIAQTILDLTVKHPSFLRDLAEMQAFPLGNGTIFQQPVFRGAMPQIERGFESWKKLINNTGCNDCSGPDCAYTWTDFGGNGFEFKSVQMMTRDFRSPEYCIKQIQTTAHFEEVFAKIVENLYAQIAFFKEMNIVFNELTSLAKKYVGDSDGLKPNRQDPYKYRNVSGVTLSALNIEMLEWFYEQMRPMPEAVPYDVVDGAPIYSLLASHQLLARLYRDDPGLRQDVRFSGLANDNLMKYNFMSTIRGMFIAAPILYPRRFKIDQSGEPIEILPFINGIPMAAGAFTGLNPDWADPAIATHEEVLIHGKYPFKLLYMPTAQTLGANTSFGPEFDYFNNWSWVNPMTNLDPGRRVGYFWTSATIGLAPQFSDAIYGILVPRPSARLTAQYNPTPICPPTDPVCDNSVPAVGCPCPLIVDTYFNNASGNWILNLAVATTAEPQDQVDFGVDTGGYITGTITAVSSDGLTVEVDFGSQNVTTCDHFTTIFCDDTRGCSSTVAQYLPGCPAANQLTLILQNPIKADATEVVTVTYADGTTADLTIASADLLTNTYVFGGFTVDCQGIVSVCVPTATDATCPGCAGPTLTPCVED